MTDRSGCLEWQEKGRIGILKISNKSSNMIPRPDFADISQVREWIEREEILGIILKGEGRHFSAGADLEYFKQTELGQEEYIKEFEKGKAVLDYLESIEKPVVAAIDGVCFGGGLEIALASHIRYCSSKALFGFPEINHGIVPGLGGVDRLVKTVGRSRALEMLLTGDYINSQRAYEIGLVNYVVEQKSCLDYSLEVMEKIISKGAKPVAYAIRSVNNACNMEFEAAMMEEGRMFADLVINQYGGDGA